MSSDHPRVIFDTNVLISAAMLRSSVPRAAFDLAMDRGTLLVSQETITELDGVLRRPSLRRYISDDDQTMLLAALLQESELVVVTSKSTACRDPKDNKFLELAIDGQADYIVSGDADLLALHPFRGVAIVSPSDFIQVR